MTKLKLRAIKDGSDMNRYCGPSVISALTDLTTGEAARLIRKQGGRNRIMGTYTSEMRRALQALARRGSKKGSWKCPESGPFWDPIGNLHFTR